MRNIYISLLVCLSLCAILEAQEGWRKVNVYPHGTDLNAVDSYDEFLVAVGELGVVRYTYDFGETWTSYETQEKETFLDIAIYDKNSAIAVGYRGSIYVTTDRAKSWQYINLNTSEYLNNVQYYGKKYGILCGSNGFLYESVGDISTWIKVESYTTNNLNEGIIFDQENAIVCGDQGTLLVKNKGIDWEKIDLGTDADFERIVKFNDTTAFLVTSDFQGYYSTDRGLNWNKVAIDAKNSDDISHVTYMEVWEDKVIIYAKHKNIKKTPVEYVSTNLKNWKYYVKGHIENGSGTRDIVKLSDKSYGIGVCSYGRILKVTFEKSLGLKNRGINTGAFITEMQSLSAIDEQNYMIITQQAPTCMYTSDAGKSWSISDLRLGMTDIIGVAAFSTDNIYAGGDTSWTEDNSTQATFYRMDRNGIIDEENMIKKGGGLRDFHFVNKDCGVMSTFSGFHLTKDGGETWEFIRRPAPRLYIDKIETPELGYIVTLEHCISSDTTLFSISEDWGETWTEKTSPEKFTDFMAIDKNTFLASYRQYVGENEIIPHLFLTRDAGDSWNEIDLGGFKFDYHPDASFEYNMDNGTLVVVFGSYYGKILTSEDWGETWTSTDLGFDPNMNLRVQSIEFVNHKPIILFRNNLILVSEAISDVAEDSKIAVELTVYPNPANSYLHVETEVVEISNIKIYSSDLRLVKELSFRLGDRQKDINIKDLTIGSYLLVITDKNDNLISKRFNIVR